MTTPPAAPTPEESAAIAEANFLTELRTLAQEIRRSGQLGFTPGQLVKGVVKSVEYAASPPTITINLGGDTTTDIAGVRIANNYTPLVGQTVVLERQGAQLVALCQIADTSALSDGGEGGGWIKATLVEGTHDGNGNGEIRYRRILDHGSWKMQWRGGWNVSGSSTIISGLPVEYRPKDRCTVIVPRNAHGLNDVKLDFDTNGSVVMAGEGTTTAAATASGDVHYANLPGSITYTNSDSNANHNGVAHYHQTDPHEHGFSGGSHVHSPNAPLWVSFNNISYFL